MERKYLVMVSSFVPFGPARTTLLLKYFDSAAKIWNAKRHQLTDTGLSKKLVDKFIDYRNDFKSKEYFESLEKLKITYLLQEDKNYPVLLKQIDLSPLVLYVKGKLKKKDEKSVAIVGARELTDYGKEVAKKLSSTLSKKGVTIVSGLARGIDTLSHRGALDSGGRTIAVLGCGLDIMYPPENLNLSKQIAKSGAVVSEYPLGYGVKPQNFAARNRIISGLSQATVVVEGRQRSGTFLTAGHALNQGKTVMAVPGPITSPMSEAPNYLIKNGAKVVTSAHDILEELDL